MVMCSFVFYMDSDSPFEIMGWTRVFPTYVLANCYEETLMRVFEKKGLRVFVDRMYTVITLRAYLNDVTEQLLITQSMCLVDCYLTVLLICSQQNVPSDVALLIFSQFTIP